MSDPTPLDTARSRLDRACGREDDLERLRSRAADAPADYLAGALENEQIGPEILRLILKNREATSEIVGRVGRNREWLRDRDVRVAFVANPLASSIVSRQVLPHLSWRDLADVAVNLRLSPALRREAEKLLRMRLPEMVAGERVALARSPSRGIVELLTGDGDPAVLRALAGNPRALESDVLRIVGRQDLPADFLVWLSTQSSWGLRRDVMRALVVHPRTPAPVALRLILALSPADREEIRRDPMAPRLVRVAAERAGENSSSSWEAERGELG